MLVIVRRLLCRIAELTVLDVVGDDREHIAQTEIERLDVVELAVEGDGEHFLLNAEAVFRHTGNDSADLKDAEIGSVAHIRLYLTELCGDDGVADGLDVGVGGVCKLDVVLDLDAEILELVVVRPHI